MTTRRRLSPDERREQILAAAAGLLARSQAVTVAATAKAAGVAPTLVYHYFGNAEGLVQAVADRERQLLLDDTDIDPALSTGESIEQAVRAYFSHFEAARGDLQLVYTPGSPLHEGYQANHAVHIERVLRLLSLTDTPLLRLAVESWLGFVTHVATARPPEVEREQAVRLCRDALLDVVAHAREQSH